MPRSKKQEKKAEAETITIDVASFVRTRDSVVTGLANLQDAILTLKSAYIKHTNAVLGDHEDLAVDLEAHSRVGGGAIPLLGSSLKGLEPSDSPNKSTGPVGEEKKERKKRQHDPNAPKRPLTPFFLYMQTARPIIAGDLGPEAAKGAVSTEGTNRWAAMEEKDKALWTDVYKENLRLYNARMHSYKIGANAQARDMTDAEAEEYASTHNIGSGNTADAQLIAEAAHPDVDAEGEVEVEEEPEKEPTPPPAKATPKVKSSRKSKTKAPEPEAIVPPAATAIIVPPKAAEATPGAKRKRAGKKDEVVEKDEPVAAAAAAETPKSGGKPRKKKAKSDN